MRRQNGFTLIELMIGMLVGLIVLSAVGYSFLSTLRSSKDIVNSARLNRDTSVLTDVVVGELRRTGYYPVSSSLAGFDSGFGTTEPDLLISGSCVLYAYYDDGSASVARRGFSFVDPALNFGSVSSLTSSACASLTTPLNDVGAVRVSDFNVAINVCSDSAGNTVSAALCQSSNVSKTYLRSISVDIDLENANDDTWQTRIREVVKLPNDLSPGTGKL